MALLIRHATLVTVNTDNEVIDDGFLLIEGAHLTAIGPMSALDSGACQAVEIIDAAGYVVTPGLINAHTHAAMVLMRGYFDDQPLMPWLQKGIWPLEARMFERGLAEDAVYAGTRLAIAEMLLGGTTCFNDMYHSFGAAARAIVETGIRAIPSGVVLGIFPDALSRFERTVTECRDWQGAGDGRLTVKLAPHAVYSCDPPLLRRVRAAAEQLSVGLHTHLSETPWEVQEIESRHGKSPVALLDDLGLFDLPMIAAHCVHVTDADLEILCRKNVAVAHNPTSNLKLASGIAPVARFLREGLTVGVGTDGAASNNNLDQLEEVRLAALLAKGSRLDATAVDAVTALRMATIEGARALGLDATIGSLEVGKLADVVLWDFQRPHLTPRHNVVSNLIYAAQASDADTVIVNGEVLVQHRQLTRLDLAEVASEANRLAFLLTQP